MFPKTQTCQASDGTEAEVPTIHYLPTLQYIISWTNITNAFPNAYLVKHGDTILPFLSDKDKTRELLRKACQVSDYRLAKALSISGTLSYYPPIKSNTHTYQLQDASNPRPFIVLSTRDGSTNELLDQFRLYYLYCRLAGVFLEKYGVYMLALLQMVKFGVSAGGVVVPRLLQFRAIQEGGHEEEESFEERVDFAISRMHKVQQEQQQRQDFDSARAMTFSLTSLQWEMIDELGSFLEDHDYDGADSNSSSTPGDLYKATSAKEGHVRWMCSIHYNELYPEVTRRPVLEAIQDNNGSFNERKGTAKVRIANAARGADFCWALLSTPFLQHIYIFLNWIATAADLKELVFAILQSNLQQIELSVQADSSATLQGQPTLHNRTQTIQQKLDLNTPSASRFLSWCVNLETLTVTTLQSMYIPAMKTYDQLRGLKVEYIPSEQLSLLVMALTNSPPSIDTFHRGLANGSIWRPVELALASVLSAGRARRRLLNLCPLGKARQTLWPSIVHC
ncbi:hypothetical protein KI688_010576 [Linnemannia hyalina]|uniref:Uncharacterized protein n=1 Tax=Linnemannia hyalina TaxID=64524 RepID=A0A9P7XVW5_9FUNG|nr:hypothetical protein KI688_010576 [Linnemannia hyalina]